MFGKLLLLISGHFCVYFTVKVIKLNIQFDARERKVDKWSKKIIKLLAKTCASGESLYKPWKKIKFGFIYDTKSSN